jgi:hypothetical protein
MINYDVVHRFQIIGGRTNSASVKKKFTCRADVGQRGKHSLQFQHSWEAISGRKLISRRTPLSINPMAFFFFTSLQYRTQRPQRIQKDALFLRRALSAPYSLASSSNFGESGACASIISRSVLRMLSIFSDLSLPRGANTFLPAGNVQIAAYANSSDAGFKEDEGNAIASVKW